MNLLKWVVIVNLTLFVSAPALAVETLEEKKEAVVNDVKRDAAKSMNQMEEATCVQGDTKCLVEKARNRVEEAGADVTDRASELKDKLE